MNRRVTQKTEGVTAILNKVGFRPIYFNKKAWRTALNIAPPAWID
jgi:hypothetical protein